jgi:hypothetical protein
LETGFTGSYYPDLTTTAGTNNAGSTSFGNPVNTSCTVYDWSTSGSQVNAINTQAYDACQQGGTNDINIVATGTSATTVVGYAIYGHLVSNTSGYFCIDSTGRTGTSEPTPGTASTTCM